MSDTLPSVRFGFMKFVVRDLPAMQRFYERALGLELDRTIELPDLIELLMRRPGDAAGFGLILYWNKDGRDVAVGNGHGPLGVYVDEVDAAYALALAHGATPLREPFGMGDVRIAMVLDPEGHELEYIAMPKS